MKLLAFDTSTEIASVALLYQDEYLVLEQPSPKTHALCILPMIDKLLAQAQISFQQLDSILYGCGPGSFTGLRIACSIAKGLAFAHDLGLIPVGSLDAIAYSVRENANYADKPVLALIDARMQQMYWAYYPAQKPTQSAAVDNVENIHLPEKKSFVMAGLGIDLYWPQFADSIKENSLIQVTQFPNAKAMIQLALATGLKPMPAARALPVYVRNQVI